MYTLMEDGEQLDLTEQQRDNLLAQKLIYHCPDCGEAFYHISPGQTWDDVETALRQ